MLLNIIPLLVLCALLSGASASSDATQRYDIYTAEPASEELLAYYESTGVKDTCTKEIKDCDPNERRRVDGSCNNLDHPAWATFFEPVYRVLPANYYNNSYPTKSVDGSEKELCRSVRNTILGEVKASSMDFTQALPGYAVFSFIDIASPHDFLYFVRNKTDCCTQEGMKSSECSPNIIPEDDPVHRLSGIRCLNLTTPLTYSHYGCTKEPVAHPINQATGTFDLSSVYDKDDGGTDRIRSHQGGQLEVVVDEAGIIWPPSGAGYCPANQPGETICFAYYNNVLLQSMLINIWTVRHHNQFATELAAVNPCWDDDMLFETARDINIAIANQVYFYEWLPNLIPQELLIKTGVIGKDPGFRNVYDDSAYPTTSMEFAYINRWFHSIQEGTVNMYDPQGTFLKGYPIVNITFRPGFLGVDNNMLHLSHHMFRQQAGKIDHAADPEFLNNGLPYIQKSADILTSDLYKSRLLGLAPYIDYVNYCTGHRITCFEDLADHIDPERIIQLKRVYKYVEDIDLMAGIWSENFVEGGQMPATMACLFTEYLSNVVRADRHWYESSERPYAFTEDQLLEIRKATFGQWLCDTADGVTEVQPHAFRTISPDNPLMPCSERPEIDFTKWADPACSADSTSSDSSSQARSPFRTRSSLARENRRNMNQEDNRAWKPARRSPSRAERLYREHKELRMRSSQEQQEE